MSDVNKVTLGNGTLYLDGTEVGYLSGAVTLEYGRDIIEFKPSNEMGPVKQFVRGESMILRAEVAQLEASNLRLAMGIAEAVSASTSYPGFENSPTGGSYSPPDSASYDVLKFGGSKSTDEMPLRFVHTRPNGKDVVVCMYNAVATPEISIPFNDEDVTVHEIAFKALHVTSRSEGDQIGFIAEQVQGS